MDENFEKVTDCLNSAKTQESLKATGETVRSRIKGMLAGNIAGDMLGLTQMNFHGKISSAKPVKLIGDYQKDILGGGVFEVKAGAWTDDTSMLIALAESLLETNGKVDTNNERKHYLRWFYHGEYTPCGESFDIGNTVRSAIEGGKAPTNRRFNGNGALMRSSVLAAQYILKTDKDLIDAAGLSCGVTHGHPVAKFTNVIYTLTLKKLVHGEKLTSIMEKLEAEYSGLIEDLKDIFLEPEVYQTTPYCVTSLETALWLNRESSSFEEAVLKAVNIGGDSDTIGAITGAIAGAAYGFEAIPERWTKFALPVMEKYEGLKMFL
jgi:ADP-ribosyl-[dinitrogen reductase] hydrolase